MLLARWLAAVLALAVAFPHPVRGATQEPGPAPPADAPPPAPALERPASSDGRRTTSRFLSNLGRNTVGMFSRDNLAPISIGGAAAGVGAFFDDDAQRYFGEERRAKWLGDFANQLGKPYVLTPIAGALFGLGRLSHDHPRFRNGTYDIAQVFLINAVYTTAIKYPAHRLRPDRSNRLSFPSGHTSNAFAWATVASHYYGPWFGVPAYAFAGLIGIGRMEKDAHYLSDVLGGAALGCLVGLTVVRRDAEPRTDGHARRWGLTPRAVPGGAAVEASLVFR